MGLSREHVHPEAVAFPDSQSSLSRSIVKGPVFMTHRSIGGTHRGRYWQRHQSLQISRLSRDQTFRLSLYGGNESARFIPTTSKRNVLIL
jgi:hypothetical protein